jgi:hypothetical protein
MQQLTTDPLQLQGHPKSAVVEVDVVPGETEDLALTSPSTRIKT